MANYTTSPWVRRAEEGTLPAKSLDSYAPAGPTFMCWEALTTGNCPFGHEWQMAVPYSLSSGWLPIATYGGEEHELISSRAHTAWARTHAGE